MTGTTRPDPIDLAIGARIRARREALGLSQTVISHMLGMSHQQFQHYEKGQHTLVLAKLLDMADALATTVAWLVGETHDHPQSGQKPMTQREATRLIAAYERIERADDRGLVLRLVEALARPDPNWPEDV